MAKTTPAGSMPEKVTLRPTAIGVHVIERLNRPGTEKSALLRHLVELGYACEQAGFILDGTVLRHGGSVWDVQPQLASAPQVRTQIRRVKGTLAPSHTIPKEPESASDGMPMASSLEPAASEPQPENPVSSQSSGLAKRLRGLSG